jgi:predicted nucleotidyltransferase
MDGYKEKSMAKKLDSPQSIANEFTEDVKAIYGADLVAVMLYGSALSGHWDPKRSNINFLIVLSEVAITRLDAAFPLVEKWRKRLRTLPIFMTKNYIAGSLDSFPVEFLHMKRRYQLLYGEDVLAPLVIPHANLRLQCEEQIKGKLLHLREEYLATLGKRYRLQALVTLTLPPFAVLFKSLLALKDAEIPALHRDIIMRTAELYGLDRDLFQQLIQAFERKGKFSLVEMNRLAAAYITEINKLTLLIDQME